MENPEEIIHTKPIVKPKIILTRKQRIKRFFRRTLRFFFWSFISFVVIFSIIGYLLTFPYFQNKLVPYVTELISSEIGAKVELKSVDIALFDKVVLNELKIYDQQDALMIYSEQVKIGIISLHLWDIIFKPDNVKIIAARSVTLEKPRVHLYERRQDGDLNIEFLGKSDNKTKKDSSITLLKLNFPSVNLNHLVFTMVDSNTTEIKRTPKLGHLNYQNLQVSEGNIDASFSFETAKELTLNLRHLDAYESNSKVKIDTLSTDFIHHLPETNPDSLPYFELLNSQIVSNHSHVNFNGFIRNEKFSQLFKAKNPKNYEIYFTPSNISFETINQFIPKDLPLKGDLEVQGDIKMNLKNIKGKNLKIIYNENTFLQADASLRNFTDPEELFIESKISKSYIQVSDIDTLLKTVELPKVFYNLGSVAVDGKFTGFINDFVADADFLSELGSFSSNINMKIKDDLPFINTKKVNGNLVAFRDTVPEIFYSGLLITENFNVDKLLQTEKVCDKLNFTGTIQGKNFEPSIMESQLSFHIHNSNLSSENIDSASGDLDIVKKIITGDVNIVDHEGSVRTNLLVNLRETPQYTISGQASDIDLKYYAGSKDSLTLTSIFDFAVAGDSLDDLNGYVHCFRISLLYPSRNKNYEIEDLDLLLKANGREKDINLTSSMFDFALKTNLYYREVPSISTMIAKEAVVYFENIQDSINNYYSTKNSVLKDRYLKSELKIENLSPILYFLGVKLNIAGSTKAYCDFDFQELEKIKFGVHSDSLIYEDVKFRKIDSDYNVEKIYSGNLWKLEGDIKCRSIRIVKGFTIHDLDIKQKALNQAINVKITANQARANNNLALNCNIFVDSVLTIKVDSLGSFVQLGNTKWTFDNQNRILLNFKNLWIENMFLANENQLLSLEGELSAAKENLTFRAHNFDLNTINKIVEIKQQLGGIVNAKVKLLKFFSSPLANINGSIGSFSVGNLTYGDIVLTSDWSELTKKLNLRVNLLRISDQDTLLGLGGYYDPQDKKSPMNFMLTTHSLPLNLVEPFIKDVVYGMKGSLSLNNLLVRGTIQKPNIYGEGYFKNAQVGIKYLNTKFSLDSLSILQFNQSSLTVNNLHIFDSKNGTAKLTGKVNYEDFSEVKFNFDITDINNFLVLNTTKKDNELFYGTFIIKKGKCNISGTVDQMNITASASTHAGTVLNVPISSYRKGNRLDYVYFKGQDKKQLVKSNVAVEGISLNLSVEATPDAEMNIIFDEKAGDVIHGQGSGAINLLISPDGEFSMFGQYEVDKGDYLFTMENIINKKFNIESGGTITWTGSPFDAVINLEAAYKLSASISSLDTTQNSARRLPVEVLMKLRGSLLQPEIGLSIALPNLTQSEAFTVVQQLKNIENDAQELNRQVFSLLVFGRFAPPSSFFGQGATSSAATSSLSELLSSQLNSWLSQTLDNKIGVSLSSNRFDDITAVLQAKLFNDRVTISRNGAIMNTQYRDLTVGNISIQIKLLPNPNSTVSKYNQGQLAIEIFNRENLSYSNTVTSVNRGVGIYYKKDFDSILELLGKKKSNKKEKEDDSEMEGLPSKEE